MAQKRVGPFRGHPVHGSGGEWVWNHNRYPIAVRVHPYDPSAHGFSGDYGWAWSIDVDNTAVPGVIDRGLTKEAAVREATEAMRDGSVVRDAKYLMDQTNGASGSDPEFDMF